MDFCANDRDHAPCIEAEQGKILCGKFNPIWVFRVLIFWQRYIFVVNAILESVLLLLGWAILFFVTSNAVSYRHIFILNGHVLDVLFTRSGQGHVRRSAAQLADVCNKSVILAQLWHAGALVASQGDTCNVCHSRHVLHFTVQLLERLTARQFERDDARLHAWDAHKNS